LVQSENLGDQKKDAIFAVQLCCEMEMSRVRHLTPDFRQT